MGLTSRTRAVMGGLVMGLVALVWVAPAMAMDGFAVAARFGITGPGGMSASNSQHYNQTKSQGLWRFDIADTKVVATSRICDYRALYPAISPEGDRIVFFRQNTKVDENGEPVGAEDTTWHLSVMNADGSGLKDLLTFGKDLVGTARLDWPVGGYVHYQRPKTEQTKGDVQVWRVNVDDPKKNELVMNFTPEPGPNGTLDRFSLNITGDRLALRALHTPYGSNDVYATWPMKDPQDGKAKAVGSSRDGDKGGRIRRCMVQISPSGKYMATFNNYGHQEVMIHQWDWQSNEVRFRKMVSRDMFAQWFGEASGGGHFIRWSVNSDKWFTMVKGQNMMVVNWVDEQAIQMPREGGKRTHQCAGDLWVNGPAGSYETSKGPWVAYGQVDTTMDAVGGKAVFSEPEVDAYKPIEVGQGEQVQMKAHLVAKSVWKDGVSLNEQYPRALIVYRYKVEEVTSGKYDQPFVHVAHWAAWNRQTLQPILDRPVNKSYELTLEPMETYEVLESEPQLHDIEEDLEMALMFDVTGTGTTPAKPVAAKGKGKGKAK